MNVLRWDGGASQEVVGANGALEFDMDAWLSKMRALNDQLKEPMTKEARNAIMQQLRAIRSEGEQAIEKEVEDKLGPQQDADRARAHKFLQNPKASQMSDDSAGSLRADATGLMRADEGHALAMQEAYERGRKPLTMK